MKRNKVKRRVLLKRFNELMFDFQNYIDPDRKGGMQALSGAIAQITTALESFNNNPTHDSDHTGSTGWIEHTDVDESTIRITDVSGGDLKIRFQEFYSDIWGGKWKNRGPNGDTVPNGGTYRTDYEIDSNIFDGDVRLKITCEAYTTYHLEFTSEDR